MQNAVTQDDIDIFSSDPAGVKEQPPNPYYQDGVEVGYTAPGKWWNWLWNKITSFLSASKADRVSMLTELKNVLASASITPDSAENGQLAEAVDIVCYNETGAYDNREVTEEIGGVSVTHKINQPYVVGHTLYIPDTEML